VSHVIWFKPPWAVQIADGTHTLRVGRHRVTGTLTTDSTLPYFEDELLTTVTDDLLDEKEVSSRTKILQIPHGHGYSLLKR
jgi:hypothetical protein